MRFPQVLLFDHDSRIAVLVRPFSESRRWIFRQMQRVDTLVRELRPRANTVVLVRAGRDLEREFTLLDRLSLYHPEVRVIFITDPEMPAVQALAWDLGATHVMTSQQVSSRLPGLLDAMLKEERC